MARRVNKLLLKQQLTSPFHRQISLAHERAHLLIHHLGLSHYTPEERERIRQELALTKDTLIEADRMLRLQQKFPFSLLPTQDEDEIAQRKAQGHPCTQEEINQALQAASSQGI